jgi:hypothetical protein
VNGWVAKHKTSFGDLNPTDQEIKPVSCANKKTCKNRAYFSVLASLVSTSRGVGNERVVKTNTGLFDCYWILYKFVPFVKEI